LEGCGVFDEELAKIENGLFEQVAIIFAVQLGLDGLDGGFTGAVVKSDGFDFASASGNESDGHHHKSELNS
jgi:hypothetical protein